MRRQLWWVTSGALAVAGCATPPASNGGEGALAEGLVPSLNVQIDSAEVRFRLLVTNAGAETVELTFPSTQRFDFSVETPSGETVWTWSADRSFGQMLGTETVAPGATLEYGATWASGRRPGRYVAVGRVTSSSTPVELRTEFEIPAS